MSSSGLFFRGNRNYLWGADALRWVIRSLYTDAGVQPSAVDFTMHQHVNRMLRIIPYAKEQSDAAAAAYKDMNHHVLLMPGDHLISERNSYDYDDIDGIFDISANTAHVLYSTASDYDFLALYILAFKKILQQRHINGPALQYIFVRLLLHKAPFQQFTVTYTRKVGGRFYEAAIECGREVVGKLYFAERHQ